MKNIIESLLRSAFSALPERLKGIMFELSLDENIHPARLGRALSRILPALNIVEIAASGEYGIISSSINDNEVLTEYGKKGTFAPEVVREFLAFFAKSGGTFFDIGANIGLTTIPIAKNPTVRCFAFEPEPSNFLLLQQNIRRNILENKVECHQLALFEKRGSLTLAINNSGNIGDHRLNLGTRTNRTTIDIEAVPLDDFLDHITGPLAVKIDTQGAEPYIVKGGKKMLDRADLLAMEFCPYLMRQLGGDIQEVLDLIASFPYVSVMSGGKAEKPHYLGSRDALKLLKEKLLTAKNDDGDYVDILARRAMLAI